MKEDKNLPSLKQVQEQTLQWLHTVATVAASVRPVPRRRLRSRASSFVLNISDVHWGKKVRPNAARKYTYNMDVADERILSIPESVYNFMPDDVDEIRILHTGDLVDGEDIFPQQNGGLEAPLIHQTKRAVSSLWEMYNLFAKLYDVPVVADFVPGNHGRASKTAHASSNWDNAICQSLSFISASSDKYDIVVNPYYDSFNLVPVKDKIIAMNHYGLLHLGTPAMQKKFAGWILSKDFDLLAHGHWHQWQIGTFANRVMFSNGSVCGPDDLSEDIAREENPRQGAFIVTSGEPISSFFSIEWQV